MGLFDGTPYGMNPYGYNPNLIQRPMVPNPPTVNVGQSRQLEKVNGIESVKQYPMSPNSMVALFDMNDDIFYVKTTDASNYPTIRIFRFYEESQQTSASQTETPVYVTLDEFNALKEELKNGQQSIWDAIDAATKPDTKSANGKHKANG